MAPLSALTHKGYPAWAPALPAHQVGQQGWNLHQADWPLPCAVLRQGALAHNLGWMQRLVQTAGADLAPHGKTTLSPELMRAQVQAGAWGITFATVGQLAWGLAHGIQRAVIANQVMQAHDLAWLQRLHRQHPGLQTPFLLDSDAQLDAIEAASTQADAASPGPWHPLDVLVELGLPGGRTGCRHDDQALALARRASASPAVRLVGIECYEGLWAQGNDEADAALVAQLMQRVHALVRACDAQDLFHASPEILVTAGGSAVYDLVLQHLRPAAQDGALSRPVRALLRSGCYITHDHGSYLRYGQGVSRRLQALPAGSPLAFDGCASGLQGALEVWTLVQSVPEPGLAIVNAGKRDLSHDLDLPTPLAVVRGGVRQAAPATWCIARMNDQHAYLSWPVVDGQTAPVTVGDRVVLGISHPCTTFDRWRWMPVVDDEGRIVDAITTGF